MSNIKTTLNVVLSAQEQAAPSENVSVPDTGLLNSTSAPIVFGVLAILIILAVGITTLIKRKILRPHFRIAKKKSLMILLLTVFIVSGVASALIQFNITNNNDTSAVSGTITDDLLEVTGTSAGTLTLNASILGTEELAYIKDTITVSEEVSGPYTIYLTAGDDKLVNTENPELFIQSIAAAGELTDKTFGYTIGNPEGQTDVTWNPVSTTKTAIIKSNATVANKTFDVYYAVRAKDIEAGTYGIDVNYEISIDFDGTLQGMSSAICERMTERANYTFVDIRDEKTYPVSRRGNTCAMMAPLALELSTRMVLTNEDTDLNTVASYAPVENTSSSEPSSSDDFTPVSSFKVREGSSTYVVYGSYAAFPSPAVNIMKDYSMSDSLCPKGWHTYDMRFSAPSTPGALRDEFGHLVIGKIHEAPSASGDLGWAQVAYANYNEIHCIANTTALSKVEFEGTAGVEPIAVVTTRGETEFVLPESTEEREGYEFIGWSVADDGTVDYLPNVTYALGSISDKLYAVWAKKITGVTYMQDFTDSTCLTLTVGKQYALRDKRDEKLYSVTKMKDGGCWMTRDLDFDVVAGETLTSDTTALVNVSSWTFTKADERKTLKDDNGAHYYDPNVVMIGAMMGPQIIPLDGPLSTDDAVIKEMSNTEEKEFKKKTEIDEWDYETGTMYDSICPTGWHLPGIGVAYTLDYSYSGSARNYVMAYNRLYGSSDNPASGYYDSNYDDYENITHIEDYFQSSDAGLLRNMEKLNATSLIGKMSYSMLGYKTSTVYLTTHGAMVVSRVKEDITTLPTIQFMDDAEYINELMEISEGVIDIEKEYGPNMSPNLKIYIMGESIWVPVRCMYTPRGYEIDLR